jgi:hypothetical protein
MTLIGWKYWKTWNSFGYMTFFQYFDHITVICWWNSKSFLTKMISEKSSTNWNMSKHFLRSLCFNGWIPMELLIEQVYKQKCDLKSGPIIFGRMHMKKSIGKFQVMEGKFHHGIKVISRTVRLLLCVTNF